MFSRKVRKKFEIRIASELMTTASVGARPTPTAPSLAVRPWWQLTKAMMTPKQKALQSAILMSRGPTKRMRFSRK